MAGRMILGEEMGHVTPHDAKLRFSLTETAVLIRAALKRAFPGQKFSVRVDRYANGSSINVRWVDGPTKAAVEAVAKRFGGAGFDGMIDLKYHVDHYVTPDGEVSYARTGGGGSTNTEHIYDPPSPNAIPCSMGTDYVFCNREASPERMAECRRDLEVFTGVTLPESDNEAYRVELPVKVYGAGRFAPHGGGDYPVGTLVRFVDSETESALTILRQLHDTRSYA